MKKSNYKILALMLIFTMLFITACSENEPDSKGASGNDEKITLKIATQFTGVDTKTPWFREYVVKTFNEKYGNEIELDIEEIAGEQNYVDKMRLLLSTDQLPDIVQPAQTLTYEVAQAGKAIDLTPFYDANPELKDIISETTLVRNSLDGKIWGAPYEGSWIGLYYNKELLAKAGIENPPTTWEELFEACDKLKGIGIEYPMSMETATNAWTTSLLFSAAIGSSGTEGYEFMNTVGSKDFNKPYIKEAMEITTRLLKDYAAPDAVGGDYAKASMHFFNEESAFIANGTWMVSEFSDPERAPEGFGEKVGVIPFPGNVALKTPQDGWVITSKDPKVAEAAFKFLEVMISAEGQLSNLEYTATLPDSDSLELTDTVVEKYPLLSEMYDSLKSADPIQYFSKVWESAVVDALSTSYAGIVYGEISIEDALNRMTNVANK